MFGGTFDPVHFGHLRTAVEVRQALRVGRVKLVPAGVPAHRQMPGTTAAQRLEMLHLSVQGLAYLEVDDREIRRGGTSYMIDTLASIRDEAGPDVPVSLVLGVDAFALIHEWHRWEGLLALAHLVILGRPGAGLVMNKAVTAWTRDRWVAAEQLQHQAAGLVCELQLTQLAISATAIRRLLRVGESVDFLLPQAVIDYIRREGLYTSAGAEPAVTLAVDGQQITGPRGP